MLFKYVWSFTLYKKCPYSELACFAFSHIRTEYGEIRSISPYSVRMRENVDQNNSEYGHFSRCGTFRVVFITLQNLSDEAFLQTKGK